MISVGKNKIFYQLFSSTCDKKSDEMNVCVDTVLLSVEDERKHARCFAFSSYKTCSFD
jgi:hypothetical protein